MDPGKASDEDRSNDFGNGSSLGPADPPSQAQRKALIRSCVTCHQRKVRCDKRYPCANCVRADVLCCYPTPQHNPVRPHRMTIADVVARVARLERTVKAMENTTSLTSSAQPEGSGLGLTDDGESQDQHTEGSTPSQEHLMRDGTKSEYFNGFMLSRVLAEEEELRSVLGSYDSNEDQFRGSERLNATGILLGSGNGTADTKAYLPTQRQALQLWQTYLNNVEPLIKLLHIPTVELDIYRAINTGKDVPDELNALLFSTYFAAVTSLSSTESESLLGFPRAIALENYKRGLELSLQKANVFDSPTMRSVQALTIYITCLRSYNCSRAAWVLNGLVNRLAKSIGLHRDGKNLGLSPFESEMRRRLWYRVVYSDIRASEDLGISVADFETSSDVAFPLNVNDNQLSPKMQSLPAEEKTWTEMTMALIKIETGAMIQRVVECASSSTVPMPSQFSRSDILRGHIDRIQNVYMAYCDENVPIQRAALWSGKILVEKLEFLLRLQKCLDDAEAHDPSVANEETLEAACRILEDSLQVVLDELLRGYRWYFDTYVQYHTLTYVLWHLCIKPGSPNSSRAFQLVEDTLRVSNYAYNNSTKWRLMLQLRAKALRQRELLNLAGQDGTEFTSAIPNLPPGDSEMGDISNSELNNYNIFDWENIVDDLYTQI